MMPFRVIVAGATGLIGQQLVRMLTDSPSVNEVKLVTRRSAGFSDPKIEEILTDFDDLDKHKERFAAEAAYCCLGTTMKKAGSKDAFYKVDHDYVLHFARNVREAGVERFFVITAMGADADSMFYYNRVKGQTEHDLKEINFKELHILQPSLLLGDRQESRPGESIGKVVTSAVSFLFAGPLKKYKPIRDTTVARAMMVLSEQNANGIFVHDSANIQKLGTS
ncbi:MAG: NAD(P)H-binding protein [Cyclobacteriaceae bacterium]